LTTSTSEPTAPISRTENAPATISTFVHAKEPDEEDDDEEIASHDSPNWSKIKSFTILCICTILYSIIAEILVDTVDLVMVNLAVDEKFLGLTLFALVSG
jgi:Ca2+:H+ antiporter